MEELSPDSLRHKPAWLGAPWPVVRLNSVARVQTGVAKGRKALYDPVELPYLAVSNVQDGYVDLRKVKRIVVERSEIGRYSLRVGDVLLTEGGDADKLGRGCIWQGEIDPCLHQNHVFVVRADPRLLDPRFLSAYISGEDGRKYFLSCSKQTTNLASINSAQVRQLPLPLPNLREQQAIVAAVECANQAVQRADALIDAKLRQKRALAEQALLIPDGKAGNWSVAKLEEVAQVRTGLAKGKKNLRSPVQMPYLAVANVQDGSLDLRNVRRIVVEKDEIERYTLRRGDVLITEGGTPGRGHIWEGQIDPCLHQNHIFAVRVDAQRIEPRFLNVYVGSETARMYFARSAGQTTIATLNSGQLRAMPVPVPPLAVQRQIGDTLDAADEEIALLRRQLELLNRQKQGLMQQLLTGRLRLPGFRE